MIWSHLGIQHHKIEEKKSKKQNIYVTLKSTDWAHIEKVNDDEIKIHGKMFDVKSIFIEKGQVVVYGHYDVKEDRLLAQAKDVDSKKNQLKKSTNINVLFCNDIIDFSLDKIGYSQNQNKCRMHSSLLNQFLHIESPPPKCT
jgi:hypothetical protein